jgi:hypothetical protein
LPSDSILLLKSIGLQEFLDWRPLARSLPHDVLSKTVFRVIVSAIVLVLASNPISLLLCRTWCDSIGVHAVSGETCHHQATSDIALVGGDDCVTPGLDTMAFVREDTERLASSSSAHDGILVSARYLHGLTDLGHYTVTRPVERSSNNQPFSLALRI